MQTAPPQTGSRNLILMWKGEETPYLQRFQEDTSGRCRGVGPPAANLTPHADGHLGKWTEADFLNLLRTGKRPDGSEVSPVMPRAFGQLNEVEQKSIWLFLKSLPPVPTGQR